MSFVCDSYRSRNCHDDIGIRVLLMEIWVVSVGIRAYLTVAQAVGLADRSMTFQTTLSAYYTSLNYLITTFDSFFSHSLTHSRTYTEVISYEGSSDQMEVISFDS